VHACARHSSSAPTRRTRGGSILVPSCRTGGASSSAPFYPTQGWSTAGHCPPRPLEFHAPDPKKQKEVQVHPPPEEPLKMIDMHNHTYQMINKCLRWVLENHWWDKTKDKWVEPRFVNECRSTNFLLQLQIPTHETLSALINWGHMNFAT
jgi:hypothetical protein